MKNGTCIKCLKRTQAKVDDAFLCLQCQQSNNAEAQYAYFQSISRFDFGWLVGIIEGEGCFYCKDGKSKLKSGDIYCYPLAGFTLMSTDKDVTEKVSSLLQVSLGGPYYKRSKRKRKVVWSVQVTGYRAAVIMKVFYDYLGERRKEQIKEALNWQAQGKFKCA